MLQLMLQLKDPIKVPLSFSPALSFLICASYSHMGGLTSSRHRTCFGHKEVKKVGAMIIQQRGKSQSCDFQLYSIGTTLCCELDTGQNTLLDRASCVYWPRKKCGGK